MAARYSPAQRSAATKFVAGTIGVVSGSVHAARELAAAVAQVHALCAADRFKTWAPKGIR